MTDRMKLLIAYDGSECADAAIDGLLRAGLPEEAEAFVLTVSEMGLAVPPPSIGMVETSFSSAIQDATEEALRIAQTGLDRVKTLFPRWEVTAEGRFGSPGPEILEKAVEFNADLIVIGSHGRSAVGRLVFGSVSTQVVTQAHCSVHVVRPGKAAVTDPVKLVIGIDGSKGSEIAVETVATRRWPAGTEVHLVTSAGPFDLYGVAYDEKMGFASKLQAMARRRLEEAGLQTISVIMEGGPKEVLMEEAEQIGADCVFVGSRNLSRFDRWLLGSVSTAVTTRAHCTVEVVRKHGAEE